MTSRTDRQPQRPADTKRRSPPLRRSGFGGTLVGIFIGVALGLALAAGVAFYLLKAGNPYLASSGSRETTTREGAKDTTKPARGETGGAEKPRFDFYKILPGVEEPKVQPKTVDRATSDRAGAPDKAVAKVEERPAPSADKAVKAAERYWLQAGAFGSEADAENLKARLAFAGWEAAVQSANLPDKGGVRYRVRLGPYDNTDELNRVKGELAKRGFDVAVIKF
jgi:cell division protein FtsN